jgi:hypothetical protein
LTHLVALETMLDHLKRVLLVKPDILSERVTDRSKIGLPYPDAPMIW